MKNIMIHIFNFFQNLWYEKKYLKFYLLLLGAITTAIVFLTLLCTIISFIFINIESVITLIVVLTVIYFLFAESRREKVQKKQEEQEALEAKEKAIRDSYNQKTLSGNYNLLRRVLFISLKNTSELLGLSPIKTESDLNAPNHFLNMGDFYLYQYIVFRKSNVTETDMMREILQDEINRNLSNGFIKELGTRTHYIYEGIMHSYIDLYDIEDNKGYITISITIASEPYLRFKTNQLQNKLLLTVAQHDMHDKDF